MPHNITLYNLLISCPGDIIEEIEIIHRVVKRFNDLYTKDLGISIQTKHWSTNSFPESGDKPQNILNKQIVNECDAAIAVFWTRFGSSTDKFGSGTEEEIELLIESQKQVFMYFSSKPIDPNAIDSVQYARVKAFKEKYQGLYSTFSSTDEFDRILFAHLSQYFLSKKPIEEATKSRQSKLSVKSISDKSFSERFNEEPFIPNMHRKSGILREQVDSLFDRIKEYDIFTSAAELSIQRTMYGIDFTRPVQIKDEEKSVIEEFAKNASIALTKNFFDIGTLRQNTVPLDYSLIGTEDEKKKYLDICDLHKKVNKLLVWTQFEDTYAGCKCIKLAVINVGTTYDEDIDISLKFHKDMLILPNLIPVPPDDVVDYFLYKGFVYREFSIAATSEYSDYASFEQDGADNSQSENLPIPLLGYNKGYKQRYLEALWDTFTYDVFVEQDIVILKLHVSYLKHNTAIAFPSVLFVSNTIADIEYTITAKHTDSIINGVIQANPSNVAEL